MERLCVNKWGGGSGFLNYDEAANVTALTGVFVNKWNIRKFDELRYFTGLTKLNYYSNSKYGDFTSTGLTHLSIPESVTVLNEGCFKNNPNLSRLILYSENPPSLEGDVWSGVSADVKFYVLDSAVGAYKSAWVGYEDKIFALSTLNE